MVDFAIIGADKTAIAGRTRFIAAQNISGRSEAERVLSQEVRPGSGAGVSFSIVEQDKIPTLGVVGPRARTGKVRAAELRKLSQQAAEKTARGVTLSTAEKEALQRTTRSKRTALIQKNVQIEQARRAGDQQTITRLLRERQAITAAKPGQLPRVRTVTQEVPVMQAPAALQGITGRRVGVTALGTFDIPKTARFRPGFAAALGKPTGKEKAAEIIKRARGAKIEISELPPGSVVVTPEGVLPVSRLKRPTIQPSPALAGGIARGVRFERDIRAIPPTTIAEKLIEQGSLRQFEKKIERQEERERALFTSEGFRRQETVAGILTGGGRIVGGRIVAIPKEERGFLGRTVQSLAQIPLGIVPSLGAGIAAGAEKTKLITEGLLRPDISKRAVAQEVFVGAPKRLVREIRRLPTEEKAALGTFIAVSPFLGGGPLRGLARRRAVRAEQIEKLTPAEQAELARFEIAVEDISTVRPKVKRLELEQVERLPPKAAKELQRFLVKNKEDFVVGGSVAQRTQVFRPIRKAEDVDLFTSRNPKQAVQEIATALKEAGVERVSAVRGKQITIAGKKAIEVKDISLLEQNIKKVRPFAPFSASLRTTPRGVKVLAVGTQAKRKVVGGFGLEAERRRIKDIGDFPIIAESLFETKIIQARRTVVFRETRVQAARQQLRKFLISKKGQAELPSFESIIRPRRGIPSILTPVTISRESLLGAAPTRPSVITPTRPSRLTVLGQAPSLLEPVRTQPSVITPTPKDFSLLGPTPTAPSVITPTPKDFSLLGPTPTAPSVITPTQPSVITPATLGPRQITRRRIFPIPKDKKIPESQKGFNALVKRKQLKTGKGTFKSRGFVQANERPLSRIAAQGLGASIVDKFPNRSFTVERAKGQRVTARRADLIAAWQAKKQKFRFAKKNPRVFVEKIQFAIDSPGEVRGIPFEAQRQRQLRARAATRAFARSQVSRKRAAFL